MATATQVEVTFATINPTTGELVRTFDPISDAELDRRLESAATGFAVYRRTSFSERARLIQRVIQILESEKNALGRLMTLEMGKPLRAAVQEVEKCAWGCRYFAENGGKFLADEFVKTEAVSSFIRYQPLGPVLAVMPWNFPFWQAFRSILPPLMAGNAILLKHAPNVPQCALAIEDLFRRAGFPDGAFQNLFVEAERVERILDDSRVKAATLTGSVRAGSAVASRAGKRIKKTVLELGGSDPFIVMPSADLEQAVRVGVQARMLNAGQTCIAAKRFIVHERIADDFLQRFVEGVRNLKLGDPMEESTEIGPLARADLREGLEQQVSRSVQAGAKVLTGGRRLPGPGFFYEPTVLTEIPKGAPAQCEELFGPVASVFRVRDMEEALRVANDSDFGLGASAWTNDERERQQFIEGIEAGMAFVNAMVASDPRLPFGGVKQSGYGRELGSHFIREFTNIKTVAIFAGQRPSDTE